MSKKLSATMVAALDEATAKGGVLTRWQGGFWTYPGCAVASEGDGYRVPTWYVGTTTVRALIDRGKLRVTDSRVSADGEFPTRVAVVDLPADA